MNYLLKTDFSSKQDEFLKDADLVSLLYHDLFDYPLTSFELIKWKPGEKALKVAGDMVPKVGYRNGYFFIKQKEGLVFKRTLREKISDKKLLIAKKAAKIIAKIPSVQMVALTGALCMRNCQDEADIDLLVVTKKGVLWSTRFLVYLMLKILQVPLRVPGERNQKNKLCLNMWLDESDLVWRKRNMFTAHEIAQIVPLFNKDKTHEKFIHKNHWINAYWPNAVKISNLESRIKKKEVNKPRFGRIIHNSLFILRVLEPLARALQKEYMRNKVTKEVITPTRALFHPVDWGKYVSSKLRVFQVST